MRRAFGTWPAAWLSARFALRREDLIHVDTFALPALIDYLGRVDTPSDVARVERLNSVLAHITELPVACPPDASVADARRVVETWRDFWELHGSEYSALDGPRRLAATFVETQYGKWLAAVLHGGLGRTRGGERATDLVGRGLATTSFLLFIGLGVGFPLGVAWTRFERRSHKFATRAASAIVGTVLAAIPLRHVRPFVRRTERRAFERDCPGDHHDCRLGIEAPRALHDEPECLADRGRILGVGAARRDLSAVRAQRHRAGRADLPATGAGTNGGAVLGFRRRECLDGRLLGAGIGVVAAQTRR